jgi:hypothetical protein
MRCARFATLELVVTGTVWAGLAALAVKVSCKRNDAAKPFRMRRKEQRRWQQARRETRNKENDISE